MNSLGYTDVPHVFFMPYVCHCCTHVIRGNCLATLSSSSVLQSFCTVILGYCVGVFPLCNNVLVIVAQLFQQWNRLYPLLCNSDPGPASCLSPRKNACRVFFAYSREWIYQKNSLWRSCLAAVLGYVLFTLWNLVCWLPPFLCGLLQWKWVYNISIRV